MKTEEKKFRGKVKSVYYRTNEQFKKIGAEIAFATGTVYYPTKDILFISAGDVLHFNANYDGQKWLATDIKVDKKPLQKQTFKERQVSRLMTAQ